MSSPQPATWRDGKLGDLYVIVREQFDPQKSSEVLPYIGLEHIGQGTLSLLGLGESSDVVSGKTRFKPTDTLFGKLRPYFRKVIYAKLDGVCSTDITVLRAKPEVDPRFLFYRMASQEVVDAASQGDKGTRMPRADWGFLGHYPIPVPGLDDQREIARILGSLDDKIELNRRMNETLEAMARALFKCWFVDFEPVRIKQAARERGENPNDALCKPASEGGLGMDADLAALFPDSFEYSPLGEIPVGWVVASIGEHFSAERGLSYTGRGLSSSGIPMHNLNSILEGGGYKHEGLKHYIGDYKERHLVIPGDLIVANTEQGHKHLLIGYSALVPRSSGETGLFSHHLFKVTRNSDSPLSNVYLHISLTCNKRFRDLVIGFTNGTTVNGLHIDGLQKPLIVVPPMPLVEHFDNLANQIIDLCEILFSQSGTLMATRDYLLPKLISGALAATPRAGRANVS